jgi:hypothetical protein
MFSSLGITHFQSTLNQENFTIAWEDKLMASNYLWLDKISGISYPHEL